MEPFFFSSKKNVAIAFIIWTGLFLLLFFALFSRFEFSLQAMETNIVRAALEMIGTSTRNGNTPVNFFVGNYLVEVSPLCSGLLEFALLAAVMLSTFNVPIKKRIKGIIMGVILLFVFNILRIIISIMQLAHTNVEFAEFTHGILFRGILILGFAVIYAAWLNFARIKKWVNM